MEIIYIFLFMVQVCRASDWEGVNGTELVNGTTNGTLSCNSTLGCVCAEGWTGWSCDKDINECLVSENLCPGKNELCHNLLGSYMCECTVGYWRDSSGVCVGDDAVSCINVDTRKYSCGCVNGSSVEFCQYLALRFHFKGVHYKFYSQMIGASTPSV